MLSSSSSQPKQTNDSNSELPPSDIPFGHALRPYSMMSENYININNGSFGTCPSYVTRAKENYIQQLEARPDFFMNYTHPKLSARAREIVGKYTDANPEDIVFVRNATDAASSVLNSLSYQPDDVILLFDIVYNAVRSLCLTLVDKYNIKIVEMPTTAEILNSKEKIIALIKDHVQQYGKKIKIAVIDYISSIPAVIMPVEEIIPIFKENGILCMIDAAHAFNQIDFSIKKLNPDILHSNIHKWAPIPKSLSVLYVKKDLQHMIHPATLGTSFKTGFTSGFESTGKSSVYCVKEAMEFVERLGRKRIMDYCHNLAMEAGKRAVEIWGTELLVSEEERIPAMVNVMLPYQGKDFIERLELKKILEKFKTILQIYRYNGKNYIRFSCNIYNELSDFESIAKSLAEYLKPEEADIVEK